VNEEVCHIYRDRLVALAENPVGPEAEPELLAHLRQCPACEAEYAWLAGLCAEFETMGEDIVRDAPPVDLTEDVMKAVGRLKKPRLVELKQKPVPQPRPRASRALWIAVSAAAAALVIAALWITAYRTTTPETPDVAVNAPQDSAPPTQPSEQFEVAHAPKTSSQPPADNPFSKLIKEMRPAARPPSAGTQVALASLEEQEVLAARKQAASDPAARLQLAQWASVAEELARQLAADQEASAAAQIGAASGLPPDEAERILLAAIEADPENAYLHYALGRSYAGQPEDLDKAAAEFSAQAQLDPENALPWYQLAATMLAQGDPETAAGALETARSLPGAHPYTLQAAEYQEQALIETGVAEDVARLLVALTAGTSEYGSLMALSAQLLDHGKHYESNGQYDLAEQLYSSVLMLGTQVSETAVVSNELLAGLDIQQDALGILSGLTRFMEDPQNVDLLARQSQQVYDSLNMIGNFFTSLNTFFEGDPGNDAVSAFSQFVLANGDLGVLEFLFSNKPVS